MKKLFVLLAVATFVLVSCGGNAQEQEEPVLVEETEVVEAEAAEEVPGDSTEVVEVVEE